MIKCASCGYSGEYLSPECPRCKNTYTLTQDILAELTEGIDRAMTAKDYLSAVESYRFLADMGHIPAIREYGSILERGDVIKRDLDGAMRCFHRGAKMGDPLCAYRYARLAERTSEQAAMFWLTCSAIGGCMSAYPSLAEKLSERGKEGLANYFYRKLADTGHTDSMITLAQRYYTGVGCEQSAPYAKWFIDMFTVPPIHALKLAYKLRSVKAQEPPRPSIENYDGLLRALVRQAEQLSYPTAAFTLTRMLSERGDMAARCSLGLMYLEGKGTKKDVKQAIDLLTSSSAHGYAEASIALGDVYVKGVEVEANAELALKYYSLAKDSGRAGALEKMGDIYAEGKIIPRDMPKALRLYSEACEAGLSTAGEKADSIRARRENLYRRALELRSTSPEEAFRHFAISVGMGYLPAYTALAECYLEGIGTKCDRRAAFIWYKEAAELQDKEAIYRLGLCYADGIGTARNPRLARQILTRAASAGVIEAEARLRALLDGKKKKLIRRAYALACENIYNRRFDEGLNALQIPVKLGHAPAIYTQACLYEFGLGCPTDRELAYAKYEQAFSLGFRDPRAEYKLMILRLAKSARNPK